jgi:F-type H+-transporting ATPase subunit c
MEAESIRWIAVGLVGSIGLLGPALGLGLIGYATVTALGRNPEARGAILTNMILVAALTEAVGIYALIVSIILAMVATTKVPV